MRPACVFTDVPVSARAQIIQLLHGPWRTATRLVIVVLSAAGFSPAEIADLLDYHPATVRRWLHRYTTDGVAGLPDRPRPGRPRLGGPALTTRPYCRVFHRFTVMAADRPPRRHNASE
jgi:hypothetical protein